MTHTQGDTHKCPHAAPVQITIRGLYYPCTYLTPRSGARQIFLMGVEFAVLHPSGRPAIRPYVEKWSSQTRLEIECKFQFFCKSKQGWKMSVNFNFLASFLQRAKDLKIQCFCKGARRKKRLGAESNLRPSNLKGWSLPIELCH